MLAKFRPPSKTIPIALLILCGISFGPIIHRLGFYWDDWPSIWFLHILGPAGFKEGFAIDRPLLAWVFMITTPILGESTLAWQAFGIFTRWLSAAILYWALMGLWPKRAVQISWVAILFAVYPGFSQQYISVTYSNGFLVLCLFLFSYSSMIWAFRQSRWFWLWMIISYLSALLSLFIAEYFFGLELLRPVFLWLLLDMQNGDTTRNAVKRAGRVLIYWLPYALSIGLFLVWRLFLHESPRAEITIFEQLKGNPLGAILNLALTILKDIYKVTVLAWTQAFTRVVELLDFDPIVILIYILLVLAAGGLTFLYLIRLRNNGEKQIKTEPNPIKKWGWQAAILGTLALLMGGWPIWLTDLHIDLYFPWDRFTLPMMLGTSLLLAGLAALIGRTRWQSSLIIAALIGLACGINFQNALAFRSDWQLQKSFFWQMVWRAPQIEPGTALLTSELPFEYYSDNSLTAPLNWTYAPEYTSGDMPYIVFDIESRLGTTLTAIEPGAPIYIDYRATRFSGSTDQAILVFQQPPRCLKVMEPQFDGNWPYKPLYIPEALPLSKTNLIQSNGSSAAPPENIFGPEPTHDWCYYFQKAELARQFGEWETIVTLGEQASHLGKVFSRETASELVPFVDGYARAGHLEQAVQLTKQAYQAGAKTKNILCQTWYFINESSPDQLGLDTAMEQVDQMLGCNFPK